MPRESHSLTRRAWGSQTGGTEAPWRRLEAPWGLPKKALGPAWETPRDSFGAKIDPKLDDFLDASCNRSLEGLCWILVPKSILG